MSHPALRVGAASLVLLLVVALAAPVAAHGNYLAVDSQVSADGTVRIEGTFLITSGYVVLHADAGGEIGEVLGHVKPAMNEFLGGLTVGINGPYWADVTGPTPVWAVLHYDANNDGEFQAGDDPPIGGGDDPNWAVRVQIEPGEQPAYVLAEHEHPQQTNTSEIDIRRAHLPADGYLVIRSDANGQPGAVIGNRSLSAGVHENVTVSIDEHAYHHRPEQFSLWAVVYRGDGSGSFGDGDTPVTVNGNPVASRFQVQRTDELAADHEHTPSPTATAATTTASEPATGTATATGHSEAEHDHEHSETTPTRTPTPTLTATQPTRETSTTTPGQPGFGLLVTALAAVLALLIANRRR